MSTLTFSGIGIAGRRAAHKRLPRASTQVRSSATASPVALQKPNGPESKLRGRYELAALIGLVLLIHALIALAVLQNQTEAVVVPPKVPPIEIEISKPVPLPQALPVARSEPTPKPSPIPPKKVEAPKPVPAPAKVTPAPTPVVSDAAATPAPATTNSNAVNSNTAATEAATVSTRSNGERVTQARADADYLNNPPPKYPAIAQSRGWEGQVMLNVHVLANGRADIVNIELSSGRKTLDDAAIRAVTEWRFVPAKRGQTPIDGWVQVPIDFKLGK